MAFVINNSNIHRLVNNYINYRDLLPKALRDIPIGEWDVSRVTDMSLLFFNRGDFNEDISNWDVSRVTNMERMFRGATSFNQNIGNWNVSRVTNMTGMFMGATNFNQDIGNWVVSRVTNMERMFRGATSFNQNIGNWNVSRVTNMGGMFDRAESFSINPNWTIRPGTNTQNMFSNTAIRIQQPPQPHQQAPQGRAFEIHNAFPEMNFNKFMGIVKDENKKFKINLKDPDYPLTPIIFYISKSKTLDSDEKPKLTSDLNGQIKRLLNSYLDTYPEKKGDVMEMIQFVINQGPEYIDPYTRFLVFDCLNAYGPGGTSCTKGVYERIFLINKNVLPTLCGGGGGGDEVSQSAASTTLFSGRKCKKVYPDLLDCFYPDVDIEGLFGEWYEINTLEEGNQSPLANASPEERKEDFRNFVLRKNDKANPEKINEYIEKNKAIFDTLIIYIGFGKRTRRYRRTRRTAKKYSIKRRHSKRHIKPLRNKGRIIRQKLR